MEQDALFTFINETFNRMEKRFDVIEKLANQNTEMALNYQYVMGSIQELKDAFKQRFEVDLKIYLDKEEKRLDSAISDIDALKTDRTRASTTLWLIGATWGVFVTLIGLWISGLGSFISNILHKS